MKWATTDNPDASRVARGSDLIGLGLFSQITGTAALLGIARLSVPAFWFAWCAAVLGSVVLVIGCRRRVISKGYHWAWSVLGIFSVPGVLVLLSLPDRVANMQRGTGFSVIARGPMMVSSLWVAESETDGRQVGPRPRPWKGVE